MFIGFRTSRIIALIGASDTVGVSDMDVPIRLTFEHLSAAGNGTLVCWCAMNLSDVALKIIFPRERFVTVGITALIGFSAH